MAKLVMQVRGQLDNLTEVSYDMSTTDADYTFGPHILLIGQAVKHRLVFNGPELQEIVEWAFTMGISAKGTK